MENQIPEINNSANQSVSNPVLEHVFEAPKTNSFLVVLLSVLLFLSVSIAGFFAFQTQKLVKELNILKIMPTPIASTEPTQMPVATLDPTANWKTYTSAKYTLKYPGGWIVDEKCTKLGHPASNPCIYSSDYHPVTRKVEPGDGGSDTVTEYNVGTLLNIDLLENVAYDPNGFCSPGGPASIGDCYEKTINGNRYALRESGSYPYPPTSINAWLLINNNGVVDLGFSFSKANKVADLQIFDQILSTFKFTN